MKRRGQLRPTRIVCALSAVVASSCANILGIGNPSLDPTGSSSGAGGSGGSSSSSSSGVASSTGGGGSGATCVTRGQPFQVLQSSDVNGNNLTPGFRIIVDSSGGGLAHVAAFDNTTGDLIVRSLASDPSVLSVATYGASQDAYLPVGGTATATTLSVFVGSPVKGMGAVVFSVDANNGAYGGAFTPWPTPPDCLPPNKFSDVATFWTGTEAKYLAACVSSVSGTGSVFIGGSQGAAALVVGGLPLDDPRMNPVVFGVAKGTYYAFFQSSAPSTEFSFGTTASQLADTHEFVYKQGQFALAFQGVPTVAGDQVMFVGASVLSNLSHPSLWSGLTAATNFASLEKVPPPGHRAVASYSAVGSVGGVMGTYDAVTLVGAAPATDSNGVVFTWLTREGAPLVVEQNVYKATSTTVDYAYGGSWSATGKVVVWAEHDANMVVTMSAQALLCTGGP